MLARSQLSGFGKSEGTLIGFWESESTLGLRCCLLIRSQLPWDAPGDKWNCSFRTSSSLQLVIVCWKCIVESAAAEHSGVGCLGVFQKPSLSKLAYKLLWLLNCHVLCGLPQKGAIDHTGHGATLTSRCGSAFPRQISDARAVQLVTADMIAEASRSLSAASASMAAHSNRFCFVSGRRQIA